jgi:hypothetical protein
VIDIPGDACACRPVRSARVRRIDGRGLLSCVADAERQHDLGEAPEQRQDATQDKIRLAIRVDRITEVRVLDPHFDR